MVLNLREGRDSGPQDLQVHQPGLLRLHNIIRRLQGQNIFPGITCYNDNLTFSCEIPANSVILNFAVAQ